MNEITPQRPSSAWLAMNEDTNLSLPLIHTPTPTCAQFFCEWQGKQDKTYPI